MFELRTGYQHNRPKGGEEMNKGKKIQSGARKKKKKTAPVPEKAAEIPQEIPTEESQTEKPPAEKVKLGKPEKKKDTKAFEQLSCMCCEKKLWVKSETDQLIPGCSCALYLPGHTKCGKCSLHCTCEGVIHA